MSKVWTSNTSLLACEVALYTLFSLDIGHHFLDFSTYCKLVNKMCYLSHAQNYGNTHFL